MSGTNQDFAPVATWPVLRARAVLAQRVRAFFAERNFLEVETPLLSRDTVIDRHLDPLRVTLFTDPQQPLQGDTAWLQTSPEYGMKRLLAAGAPHIYQLTRAFRGGEQGRLHNTEFTLLEWYGVGHDYQQGMQFLSDLQERLLERGPAQGLPWREAFRMYADVDPFTATDAELARACNVPADTPPEREVLLDLLLTQRVEPQLGRGAPTLLYDYPASQAALAKVRPELFPVAERFELYVEGIELANGYHELTDADVLRQRNRENNIARTRDGKEPLPEDSRLLAAMASGLPACTGCALGFDRVVMLATGAESVAAAMAFPGDRA